MNTMTRTALVVGGGRNLGAFLAEGLADAGYAVAVADLAPHNARQVAEGIACRHGAERAVAVGVDATDPDSVAAMVSQVDAAFQRIDVLVYNAGVAQAAKITAFPVDAWQKSIAVNLTGYFLCARAVSQVMIRQGGGRIIQINSKSGKVGSKHNCGYSASKFGGVGLTQSLALDLAEHNITVHSLMLGNLLKSPMFQSLIPQYAEKLGIPPGQVEQTYIDKVPLRRGCDYQDVLNVLKFYASEEASYCTGQSINITGGQVMF
jgi:sorbitol-6-phosphate 2-dehydrogenase